MRIEKSVTSITWIPSEAISGMPKLPFEMGVAHYDAPPPDKLQDLEALQQADAFREANELRAWVEFDDGKPSLYGYSGGGRSGVMRIKLGRRTHGLAGAQAGPGQALLPDQVCFGVDDARPDDQGRRYRRALARRREPVPPSLGLRRRWEPRREVRHYRFRAVVQGVARQEHAVGRRGLAGPDDGGRVRARA